MEKLNKKLKNDVRGIALITLIVTIIVLLILAGISISMLTGKNGILNRAGEAKINTDNVQVKERIQLAYQSALIGGQGSYTNESLEQELKQEFGEDFEEVDVSDDTNWILKAKGQSVTIPAGKKVKVKQDRTGISVGDYISYTSPTASVTFDKADTGSLNYGTTPATLGRKTLFRVMNIHEDGSMDLLGVVSSAPIIQFYGVVGYNNAVYTLNEKCSELYGNTAKGITARSVRLEDITDKMIEGEIYDTITGKKKLEKYVSTQVASLTIGTYITAVDTTNNTVTYRRAGAYPDIFKYETGGILDGVKTEGTIGGSETYRGQIEQTAATYARTGTLTVPYTCYGTSHNANDFDNSEGNATAWNSMFFETGTYYWLASRCVRCDSDYACFGLRRVFDGALSYCALFGSRERRRHGQQQPRLSRSFFRT